MKGTILVVAGFLGLPGCATPGQMDDGLNALLGQDAGTAVQVLGKPSAQRTDGGYTVYAWTVDRTETRTRPAARAIDTGMTQHKVHYDEVVVVNYYCDIQIYADPAGRLIKWERDGNARGCRDYISVLRKYAETRKGK